MTSVGSSPPLASTVAISEVVVVLPWLPATATPYFMRISSASISARGITGILQALAVATSMFAAVTAADTTTTSACATFSAWCPVQ
jgi:hypothetical protein